MNQCYHSTAGFQGGRQNAPMNEKVHGAGAGREARDAGHCRLEVQSAALCRDAGTPTGGNGSRRLQTVCGIWRLESRRYQQAGKPALQSNPAISTVVNAY